MFLVHLKELFLFLVANSNSSFYGGWSLSHITLQRMTMTTKDLKDHLKMTHSQIEVFRPCFYAQYLAIVLGLP